MTDMATTHNPEADESREKLVTSVPASTETQALITEQQVLFATAAAVPLQPATTGRGWIEAVRALGASLRAAFVTSSNEPRPKRQHYPARNDFLEDSRMAREMLRL
jgi:hypothetical protein